MRDVVKGAQRRRCVQICAARQCEIYAAVASLFATGVDFARNSARGRGLRCYAILCAARCALCSATLLRHARRAASRCYIFVVAADDATSRRLSPCRSPPPRELFYASQRHRLRCADAAVALMPRAVPMHDDAA